MPGVLAVGPVGRNLECRYGAEGVVVAGGNLPATLPHAPGLAQLGQAHRGGDVGHIVFVAGGDDFVIPGAFGVVPFPGILADAVQGHNPAAFGQGVVIHANHAPFAGGDGFGGVKREAG